jgi:cytochrome c peroxidase
MPPKPLPALLLTALAAAALAGDPPPLPTDTLPKDLAVDDVPLGLGPRPVPADNPLTPARVALGRRLFFDPVLSADKTVACASCHRPDRGFAGGDGPPRGVGGKPLSRRPPTLLNRAYGTAFFWDGRADSLEGQALEPIANPLEMGSTVEEAVKRLKADADYRDRFAAAFDDGVTAANLGKALAGFERTLVRGGSPIDRFRKGERGAPSREELHGLWLYESKGGCWRCHGGPNFSDEKFHNTGVSFGRAPADEGRKAATGREADRGKFKTPTLRGAGQRGPYMHDGSLKTLEDVVEFYDRGGRPDPDLDPAVKPLGLTADERAALAAFLKSL